MSDDLQRLRDSLDRVPVPAGDLVPVRRRARRLKMRNRAVVGVIGLAVVVGVAAPLTVLSPLGDRDREIPAGQPSGQLVEGGGTVIQEGGSAPKLCLGGVLDSLPPQCGGTPLAGWDWAAVEGEETASDVTFGDFHVVGTYADGVFTVTEAGPPQRGGDDVADGYDFSTPCPGADEWPSGAGTREQLEEAQRFAQDSEDFAEFWIDGPSTINVAFTGDLERHLADLHEIWPGNICVIHMTRSQRELSSIQNDLGDGGAEALGIDSTWSDQDGSTNQVVLGSIVAIPEMQAALGERYGEGAVRLEPALLPVGEGRAPVPPLTCDIRLCLSIQAGLPEGDEPAAVLEPGETRTFPPGELRPGALIVCQGKGGVKVPESGGVASSSEVSAQVRDDGSVVARCGDGPGGQL